MFNKKQKDIIATALALIESDITNKETKAEVHLILGTLQQEGIWGNAEFN